MGSVNLQLWEAGLVSAIFITSVFLGFLIYNQDKKKEAHKFFLGFSLSCILIIISAYLSEFFPQAAPSLSIVLTRITYASVVGMTSFLFLFSLFFPFKRTNNRYIVGATLSISFILIVAIIFTSLFLKDIKIQPWGFDGVVGILHYPVFLPYAIFLLLLSTYNFVKTYLAADQIRKRQISYLFYGFGLFMLMEIVFNVLLPVIIDSQEYYRFGNYSLIIFLVFVSYAITKHHLFNIKVIATELAVALLSLILLTQIFVSTTILEGVIKGLIWVGATYGGYFLIQSVIREIKFREELQVMTNQLAHANSHLKELDQMKTEFVSLASHELLTPVSAIEGYLSMLLDEHMAKVEDPKAQKYLSNVYSSAKRLARLIADMLNISRIEEGRLLVEKKDIDLSELIKQAIEEIKFKAEEKKQKIVFENPDGWQSFGDQDKIKEVVINLIGNSIKYSKDPGTISIRIEKVPTAWVSEKWQKIEEDIRKRPLDDQEAIHSAVDEHFRNFVGGQQLMISVKDQGIGIPKEELPRLFKKFHRVGDYTTAESQGTGLGLYISRALVELHHGRIWADSEGAGKGSTFTFTLPDISDKEELLKIEAQAPKKESLKPLARPTKAAEDI